MGRAGSRVASRMGSARKSPALASRSDFVSPMSGCQGPGLGKAPHRLSRIPIQGPDKPGGPPRWVAGSAAKGGSSLTFNSHKIGGGITGRSKARRTNMAAASLLSPSDTKTSSFSIITEAGQQRRAGR